MIDGTRSTGVRVSLAAAATIGSEPIVLDGRADAVTSNGEPIGLTLEQVDGERALLCGAADGATHRLLLLPVTSVPNAIPAGVTRWEVVIDGWRFEVDVEPSSRAALRDRARRDRNDAGHSGPTKVHAIIPGVVVSVSVAPGDAVTVGQQLLVVEAMKMQNELRAPRAGTIEQVAVGAGSRIDVGDVLLVIA